MVKYKNMIVMFTQKAEFENGWVGFGSEMMTLCKSHSFLNGYLQGSGRYLKGITPDD